VILELEGALLTGVGRLGIEAPDREKLDLAVFRTNSRAIHLYGSLGFREEGCRRNAIKLAEGCYDDLVLMGKFLNGI